MTESDEEIQILDESEQQAVNKAAANVEPFDPNAFLSTLVELINSTDKDASERLKFFVAQTWARPADSSNFFSEPYTIETGNSAAASKFSQNTLINRKPIAGTQRLMYAPPAPLTKKSNSDIEKMRRPKKQVPVIDDSIYCTTDQPCKNCGGVSLSGNQVLMCKRCKDSFHMRCSQPPVSVEEASNPKFLYYCKTCLVSKKVLDNSRSRSPSPATFELKKRGLKR